MGHDHHHDGESYYLDQLCSIGICGALGLVACLLYIKTPPRPESGDWAGGLATFLVGKFHIPVLLGGVSLLVVAAIRSISLWVSVGKSKAKEHEHHHHEHHDHGHAHG